MNRLSWVVLLTLLWCVAYFWLTDQPGITIWLLWGACSFVAAILVHTVYKSRPRNEAQEG